MSREYTPVVFVNYCKSIFAIFGRKTILTKINCHENVHTDTFYTVVLQTAKISCCKNAYEDKFAKINRRENKLIYSKCSYICWNLNFGQSSDGTAQKDSDCGLPSCEGRPAGEMSCEYTPLPFYKAFFGV